MAIEEGQREKGMKQKKGIMKIFDVFFEKEKFDSIIEIGTGSGNFSLYIAKKAKEMEAYFVTFDIVDINENIKNQLIQLGAVFYNEDVDKSNRIENMINTGGRILLLNDGGLKVPQFKKYAPLLKQNDIIMSHDFYETEKNSAAGIIIMDDIKKDINNNNVQICYKEFIQFLWLCCVKEI